MSKTNKKNFRYKRINGTDIFIFVLLCVTLIAVLFKGAILEQIRSSSVKDNAVVSIRCEKLDSGVEKMITDSSLLYENGKLFGEFSGEKTVIESNIYTLSEREIVAVPVEGKVDMTGNIKVSGVKTPEGFLLPDGRIIRVNDRISLTGAGFVFDAVITAIYAE